MSSRVSRTQLFNLVQPGGVHTIADVSEHPGNIWHCLSTETTRGGNTIGHGANPDYPFLSINYASTQCTANNNDTILCYPGHVETIDAAAALTLAIAGVKIVGLGQGEDRPSLNWTAVDGTVAINAASVEIENFRFTQGIDEIVIMFDVNSTDFTHRNCEWPEAAAAQAISFVDLDGGGANACDRYRMIDCRAIQRAAGADQIVDIAQVQDGVEIINSVIDADCVNAPIYSPAIHTDCNIHNNTIKNRQAGDHAIEFSAAALGFITNNRLFASALATTLDPGSCYCAGNKASDAIDVAGVDIPLAAAAGFPADSIDAAAIATAALTVAKFATDISLWQLDTATSATALTSGSIFTFTGSIEFKIIGRVTSEIAVAVTNTQLTATGDALAANVLCTNLDISGFDVGSLLSITGDAGDGMVGTDAAGTIAPGQVTPCIATCVTSGAIATVFGAATAGAIVWEILWRPLQAGSTVTPV